jgi:hypothetical protein
MLAVRVAILVCAMAGVSAAKGKLYIPIGTVLVKKASGLNKSVNVVYAGDGPRVNRWSVKDFTQAINLRPEVGDTLVYQGGKTIKIELHHLE